VPVEGWDFSYLDGRATEERPSWGYQRLLSTKLGARVRCAGHPDRWRSARRRWSRELPSNRGGDRRLAREHREGNRVAASTRRCRRSQSPGFAAALRRRRLRPRDEPPPSHRPLVRDCARGCSRRHILCSARWRPHQCRDQRVLPRAARTVRRAAPRGRGQARRGGRVGGRSVSEQTSSAEFFDVGAVVFFLHKVIWSAPDFTVDRYRSRLRDLHDQSNMTASSPRRCLGHSSSSAGRPLNKTCKDTATPSPPGTQTALDPKCGLMRHCPAHTWRATGSVPARATPLRPPESVGSSEWVMWRKAERIGVRIHVSPWAGESFSVWACWRRQESSSAPRCRRS
jgi:hypothetical protein